MSKSRSPTPTQKPPGASTNINDPTPGPTTQPHDTIAHSNISSRTAPLDLPSPSTFTINTPRIPSLRPSPKRGAIRRAEDDLEDSPMTKRQRRGSLEAPPQRHHLEDSRSSPSSDSQSGMADTELDQKKAEQSASSMGSTTQKKKRTRTLTTPHQAAVLHSLLAQSRFPTTAMREEVGRAIGLSARKVQIWFQNQRQKARRPRSQGDAPTSRPPQYGPFPTGLHSSGMGSYPMASHVRMPVNLPYHIAGSSTLRSPESPRYEHYRHDSSSMISHEPPQTPPSTAEGERLLGPGMPGASTSRHGPSRSHGQGIPALAPRDAYYTTRPIPRYGSPTSSTTSTAIHATPILRPVTVHSGLGNRREWDLSRTLPPLIPSRPTSSSHPMYHHHGQRPYPPRRESPLPYMAPIQSQRSPSPERRFAHQIPDLHSISSGANLPPPYTLQPTPRWNPTPHPADILRPTSGHWSSRPVSRSATNPEFVASYVGPSRRPDDDGPETSHSRHVPSTDREGTPLTYPPPPGLGRSVEDTSPPPSRLGRYDPVREIFVPFTATVAATTSAPLTPVDPKRAEKREDGDPSSDEER